MNTPRSLGGLGALALAGLLTLGMEPPAQTPAPAGKGPEAPAAYRLSDPYTHENLTVFLIHGPDQLKDKVFLTLQEALAQKKVIVHETKTVSELAVENLSETEEIFIQAGDIVKGGQQDRILAVDLILPARSGKTSVKVPIASFCCEAGRWQQRGQEKAEAFEGSHANAAPKDLKLAVRQQKAQRAVWDNVAKAQMKLSENVGKEVRAAASPSSLQLTLEDQTLKENMEAYVKKLAALPEGKADVIGFACAINGKLSSADVYASNALFKKVWPVLLKGSAVEAIAELKKGQKFEPLTAEAVKTFLAEAEKGKATEQALTPRIKLVQQETKKGVLFETRDQGNKGAIVRRSYVAY
jgi:ARG/rhodanese/phosphatase superfamily protein